MPTSFFVDNYPCWPFTLLTSFFKYFLSENYLQIVLSKWSQLVQNMHRYSEKCTAMVKNFIGNGCQTHNVAFHDGERWAWQRFYGFLSTPVAGWYNQTKSRPVWSGHHFYDQVWPWPSLRLLSTQTKAAQLQGLQYNATVPSHQLFTCWLLALATSYFDDFQIICFINFLTCHLFTLLTIYSVVH